MKSPNPLIKIYPCEDNVQFWNGIITGPENSPYEGGKFHIFVEFPDEYPIKPPEIRFITPIYHCNINSAGRVCLSMLGVDYMSDFSLRILLESVVQILKEPEYLDSLDSNLAMKYKQDRIGFDLIAREMTLLKANRPEQELLIGFSELENENDTPKEYICQYSGIMMTDPVICIKSGYRYERSVILNEIHTTGRDPMTKKAITEDDIFQDTTLRELILTHKKNST